MDETGNQIAIVGRLGSRPFNLEEMQRFYLDPQGRPWTVSDEVRLRHYVPKDTGAGLVTQPSYAQGD